MLYEAHDMWNRRLWGGRLRPAMIHLNDDLPDWWACYHSDGSGHPHIDVALGILTGERVPFLASDLARYRWAADSLLHEMIHQSGARGHGPAFLAECQRVTSLVGDMKRRWWDRLTLQTCPFWPEPVRRRHWYRG